MNSHLKKVVPQTPGTEKAQPVRPAPPGAVRAVVTQLAAAGQPGGLIPARRLRMTLLPRMTRPAPLARTGPPGRLARTGPPGRLARTEPPGRPARTGPPRRPGPAATGGEVG